MKQRFPNLAILFSILGIVALSFAIHELKDSSEHSQTHPFPATNVSISLGCSVLLNMVGIILSMVSAVRPDYESSNASPIILHVSHNWRQLLSMSLSIFQIALIGLTLVLTI